MQRTYNMNAGWRFIQGSPLESKPISHHEIYASTKAGGATGPAGIQFDDTDWALVTLPHDWQVHMPFDVNELPNHGYKHRGFGWYRKQFLLEEAHRGKTIQLEFEGVATHATVYFNGSLLLRSFSAYTPFVVDVTDRAFYGEQPNVLAVYVDATIWEGWWYEGAGIYRNVRMHIMDRLHLKHKTLWALPIRQTGDTWKVNGEAYLENDSDEAICCTVQWQITQAQKADAIILEQEAVCPPHAGCLLQGTLLYENPVLWNVDTPVLYQLQCTLIRQGVVVFQETQHFGFRSIAIDVQRGFTINGETVKLKGVCNHQDHAGVGVALPFSIWEYRVRLLKKMGANAYRCAHNMPPEALLTLCDSYGLLVMVENRNFETSEEALKQLETMVIYARRHPSVILYSYANEEPLQGTEQGRLMATRMISRIRSYDPSRYVLAAMNGGVMKEQGIAKTADIVGINYQLPLFERFHQHNHSIPLLASESVSTFATRGEYRTDAMEHIASNYDEEHAQWGSTVREAWELVSRHPYIVGMFSWTGYDYRGEPTPYTWPSHSTFFGAMDLCGFPKDTFFLFQALWRSEPVLHLFPHWNWNEGEIIRVGMWTNCHTVEIMLNARKIGIYEVNPMQMVLCEIPYEAGVLQASGYIDGQKVIEDQVLTAQPPAKLVIDKSTIDGFYFPVDAIPVNVSCLDQNACFVPYADAQVHFCVQGGTVLGVGNGDPNSLEADDVDYRRLFHGKCQAIIKPYDNADVVVVQAEAEGLMSDKWEIPIPQNERLPEPDTSKDILISRWYQKESLSEEKPNPHAVRDVFDMNSWQPFIISNHFPEEWNTEDGKYALLRTEFIVPSPKYSILHFDQVAGDCEIYVNDELKFSEACETSQAISIDLEEVQNVTLSIVIRALPGQCEFGISKRVVLKEATQCIQER